MLQVFLDFNPLRGPSTHGPQRSNSLQLLNRPLFASLRPSCPSCWPSCPSCWPSWRQHVPQVLSRCPKNAILEPTSPNKCFSHLFKHPQIPKNLCFPCVFVGFLLSSPCAKIVPKCSQHAPKTSQVEPKIAILALSWPILVATCCQLGPNFAHLAPIFAPTCAETFRKSRAARQKVPQDLPGLLQDQIFESPPPPRHPKILKNLCFP